MRTRSRAVGRWRVGTGVLAAFAAVAGMVMVTESGAQAAAPDVVVSVDFDTVVAQTPARNFGFTYSTFGVDGGPTTRNPADIDALKRLGVGTARVHLKPDGNGGIVTGAGWGDTSVPGQDWITATRTMGAEPTVIVNLDQADALAVLNYLNAHQLPVKRFILGNEMDANSKSNVPMSEYVVKFRQIAAAMRQVTPGLEIGGPSLSSYQAGELRTFVEGTVRNVTAQEKASFVDFHQYGAGANETTQFATTETYNTNIDELRAIINDPTVGIQVGEFNSNWSDSPQNNTHFVSVWDAGVIGTITGNGATALMYADKNNAMGMLAPNGQPKSSYVAMAMFTGQQGGLRHFGTQAVAATSSSGAVRVFASTDRDNIVVVNSGGDAAARIDTKGIPSGTFDTWRSAGPNTSVNMPQKTASQTAFTGGTFTAQLPAMSITTFVVDRPARVAVPDVTDARWRVAGTAAKDGSGIVLTRADQRFAAASAYYETPAHAAGLRVSFDARIGDGTVGDGATFALLDPASTGRIGGAGGGLGYAGLRGVAVTLDTFDNATNKPGDQVGIATSATGSTFQYAASTRTVPPLRAVNHYDIAVDGGVVTVRINGTQVVQAAVTLPNDVVLAFTAGTGSTADLHRVENVQISQVV